MVSCLITDKGAMKIFIFLLLAVTPVFAEFEDCDNKLATKLADLIRADTRGILALQFKVTTLKMTKRLMGASHNTVEEHLRAERERLNGMNAEDPAILTRLREIYETDGTDHTADIQRQVQELKTHVPNASYWRASTRLSNLDLSTYLMLDKATNEQSEVKETDMAIAWYMHKVSEATATASGRSSAAQNMQLMSYQLAKNLGQIQGVTAISSADADAQLLEAQNTINSFLTASLDTIKTQIPECFRDNKFKGTEECNIDFMTAEFADFMKSVDNVAGVVVSRDRTVTPRVRRPAVAARSGAARPERRDVPQRPAVDRQRQAINTLAINAVNNFGQNSRVTCPGGRVVNVRPVDLNSGRGEYRLNAVINGQLYTVRRERDSGAQIECLRRKVMQQCYSDVQPAGNCFY